MGVLPPFNTVSSALDQGEEMSELNLTEDIEHTEEKKTDSVPQNLFAEDKVYLEDVSEELNEQHRMGECPFMRVFDNNQCSVVYDASINDFFDLVKDLGKLVSFFIENELVYYYDDQFENLDLKYEQDIEEKVLTQNTVTIQLAKFNMYFNYEHLVTKLTEFECGFQAAKARLVKLLMGLLQHIVGQDQNLKMFALISQMMARRPRLDLNKYKYGNQNLVEWLQRMKLRKDKEFEKAEMVNLVNTIFDNYRLDTQYFSQLSEFIETLTEAQKNVGEKVDLIYSTFLGFIGKENQQESGQANGDLRPFAKVDNLVPMMEQMDQMGNMIYNSYVKASNLDENTFTEFIFDFHYKSSISDNLRLPSPSRVDFLKILNDFMNGTQSKYRYFLEQQVHLLALDEMEHLRRQVYQDTAFGDDVKVLEGAVKPGVDNLFKQLDNAYQMFNLVKFKSSDQEGLGGEMIRKEPEKLFRCLNQYFLYFMATEQQKDLRLDLQELGFLSAFYKNQKNNINNWKMKMERQEKFDRPEDLILQGSLLKKLFECEGSDLITFELISEVKLPT
jgi:hypothetical protein